MGLPSSWPYHLFSALFRLPALCPKAVLVLPEFPSPLCHAHGCFWWLPKLELVLLHDILPLMQSFVLSSVTSNSRPRGKIFSESFFFFFFFFLNCIYDIYMNFWGSFLCFFFFKKKRRARLHSVNWKTNPPDSNSVLFFVICTDMGVDLTLQTVFPFQYASLNAKCVPSPPVLREPPLSHCGRGTVCLPISFLLGAGFQECQLDVEKPLAAPSRSAGSCFPGEAVCEGCAPNFSKLFCGF